MRDQISTGDGTKSVISIGSYDVAVGDTLEFAVALILGQGEEGILENARLVDFLVANDYKLPASPPAPPVRINIKSNQATINWRPRPGDVNPETYQDPNRGDGDPEPFEGYRVYKSTQSPSGPWTLLAQYDRSDDQFGPNTGLAYEFTDTGLLDYFEYFYTVTAFSKPDTTINFPPLESGRNLVSQRIVPGPEPQEDIGEVAVVPNPYRGDIAYQNFDPPWEKPGQTRNFWLEQDRRILFINLPQRCEIKVYTLAGDLVTTIQHNDPVQGYEGWNLTSSIGQAISSGIYLFSVKDTQTGETQVGKFVIIK
ncbi:MAG: hypothetical protein GWN61_18945 [candidate division Zixibacteria bacterium]|nr:hypothetical protein [candidate division Zixibacteria bacterium]NIS46061.1 hypothetical protein [candidate division Zixibacteria bacterium]NIU14177.1 hypothetical protein [candidate division Zixibacteria bacterium]NIV08193.1 hypothetical protein [candidate division Zixibacteria bacterium]NIX58385.1 hypothetical protein [candidate division Zixibacteria bacterium]